MKVIELKPGEKAKVVELDNKLAALQEAVGGYIEFFYPFDDNVCMMGNEEAKLNGMPLNRTLRDKNGNPYDVLAGNVYIMGTTYDGDNRSLTDEEIKKYLPMFEEPETDFDEELAQPRFTFISW